MSSVAMISGIYSSVKLDGSAFKKLTKTSSGWHSEQAIMQIKKALIQSEFLVF